MSAGTMAVTDNSFESEVEKNKGLTVVDFSATWCGPCKMLAPTLNELASELAGKVKIVTMDIDDSPEVAARFGVRSIPCLVLFRDGKEISRTVGAQGKAQLKNWIDSSSPA